MTKLQKKKIKNLFNLKNKKTRIYIFKAFEPLILSFGFFFLFMYGYYGVPQIMKKYECNETIALILVLGSFIGLYYGMYYIQELVNKYFPKKKNRKDK